MELQFEDPMVWFDHWLEDARATGMVDPNAMCLSTVGEDGMPTSRMVLLKERDDRGFVFYTNLGSQKARQLLSHPKACLNFFWRELGRQIRVEGQVEMVTNEAADAYFATRPRGSQIGAWASHQSQPLASRDELLERTQTFEQKFLGQDVPRPGHWSGFRVLPTRIEIWQAGEFRLHDRFVFERLEGAWNIQRLNP